MSFGILVIDDEDGIRRILKRLLEEDGHRVYTAKTGEEGIAVVRENLESIDVVICDLIMPGLDGLRTIEEINKLNHGIAKIVLTGYGTVEMSIRAIELGVDGFITKPFENRFLKLKVKECYIKRRIKQFIQPDILEKLIKQPDHLSPRLSHVTILFSDVRGFSQLALSIHPLELAQLMNRYYFEPISEIITKYGGLLDKYIGDSVMAIFGAPIELDRHEESAVLCAIDIVRKMRENGGILKVGIGISTGYAITGIFGSAKKREYTAFGTPVNIAARLQKMARAWEILITEETKAKLRSNFPFEKAGTISVKEGSAPTVFYRFLDNGQV
ncbi:MAG: adenylate/guanylate cyclase domain-containing response regulator [Desulfobacterota bacterium]|nr:adenylate/guanylate cyclase domain-containing response regulator [Thermodesulfobacteriota bacterium]MDW8001503.1 adenylate/guanylate cyclase domain-containing response regulator [Deltaproteobacteria bacterium]